MNIYLLELKMLKKATIYWTIALIIVLVLFMSIFPNIADDYSNFQELLDGFPSGLLEALGMNNLNLSTILGYYGFTLVYIFLMGYIQAMNFGISTVSNEMSQKTADFLFAKPITRTKILTYKFVAIITCLLFTNIVYGLASIVTLNMVKVIDYDIKILLLINLTLFIVQLLFVALGSFIAVFMNRLKSVLPLSLGFVFGFFIIDLLNQSLDDAKLSIITPFAYFKPAEIISNGSYNLPYSFLTIFLIILFTTITYVVYHKKDIPSI